MPPLSIFLPLETADKTIVGEKAFFGGPIALVRLFEKGFYWEVFGEGGNSKCFTKEISMKAPICGGDFTPQRGWTIDSHHKQDWEDGCM